jgi:crotonobetainyl-CoA:carnitine CoA-transferase CaiB-like acyl-CoA transferase
MNDATAQCARLWALAGAAPAALERLTITGEDPVLPGRFKVGAVAAASIAAAGLAAAELWRLRTGRAQQVAVEMRAAAAAFRSERYLRVDGRLAGEVRGPITGLYRGAHGRWIRLHCNFPHHEQGVLRVLGCAREREAVAKAVAGWDVFELEEALAAAQMCAAAVCAPQEWQAHPQAKAVADLPLLEILKIGESPPQPCGAGKRPLANVRVLDLTRVIAGPVCGRTLAAHGADVLLISAAHLPSILPLVIDTGLGKLAAQLDLRRSHDAERLRGLIREADVFCQAYRPDALAAFGLSPGELARLRPGIVYVTLSAYGHTGPWRARRGFDSLVQCASGIAHESGAASGGDAPSELPAQALDHASGHLAAFAAMIALARRAREGGSYLVRVSLAQTARWLDGIGRVRGLEPRDLALDDIADLLQESASPFGRLRHVVPAERLSETPAYWARPSVPLGTHPPVWPYPEC